MDFFYSGILLKNCNYDTIKNFVSMFTAAIFCKRIFSN
jgi:hypothetical protein